MTTVYLVLMRPPAWERTEKLPLSETSSFRRFHRGNNSRLTKPISQVNLNIATVNRRQNPMEFSRLQYSGDPFFYLPKEIRNTNLMYDTWQWLKRWRWLSCSRLSQIYGMWIWHSEDRASWYILIIKPTRCTDFSNLFWNRSLHVSDRFYFHHQESRTVYTAISIQCPMS